MTEILKDAATFPLLFLCVQEDTGEANYTKIGGPVHYRPQEVIDRLNGWDALKERVKVLEDAVRAGDRLWNVGHFVEGFLDACAGNGVQNARAVKESLLKELNAFEKASDALATPIGRDGGKGE